MKALLKLYWALTWGYPDIKKFNVFVWHIVIMVMILLITGIFAGLGFFIWTKLFSFFV